MALAATNIGQQATAAWYEMVPAARPMKRPVRRAARPAA
jgi:hypothetical protein